MELWIGQTSLCQWFNLYYAQNTHTLCLERYFAPRLCTIKRVKMELDMSQMQLHCALRPCAIDRLNRALGVGVCRQITA